MHHTGNPALGKGGARFGGWSNVPDHRAPPVNDCHFNPPDCAGLLGAAASLRPTQTSRPVWVRSGLSFPFEPRDACHRRLQSLDAPAIATVACNGPPKLCCRFSLSLIRTPPSATPAAPVTLCF